MKIVCVIPARLCSKRFPEKMLSNLGSKPLLQWVWQAAKRCLQFDEVVFAIDSPKIAKVIASFGGRWHFTDPLCANGTERLIELQKKKVITADIWVNWQGDEPLIGPPMIDELLQSIDDQAVCVWSLKKKIENDEELASPHVVKVVTDRQGRALYFSRLPIPYVREDQRPHQLANASNRSFKHVGLYAFTSKALEILDTLPPSPLEALEGLEQLRFLENGLAVQLHTTCCDTIGIDHAQDLERAAAYLQAHLV